MAHPPPKPVVVDDTLLLQFVIALLVCLTGAALSLLVDEDVLSAAGGEEQEVARGTDFTCPEEVLPILQVFRRCRLMYDDDGNEMPRKKRAKKNWNHRRAEASVYTDFLGSPHPTFNDRQFERIFRITRTIAERLLCICGNSDDFFTQKVDACGAPGICPKVKLLMGIKCLAYGVSPAAFQDYFQMGETTARSCVKTFTSILSQSQELSDVYLRKMTRLDARRISSLHECRHGVAGHIGSIDCMHVGWRVCPVAWQGQYQGSKGKPTLVLEAVADYQLWIWHASFGFAGSMNDINVWDRSPLLKSWIDGSFANDVDFEFEIDGKVFHQLWLMADGIYPDLSRFVKSFDEPIGLANKRYAAWQEGSRKDIERAFGVMQRKFHILVRDFEYWFVQEIEEIVLACITLHNMMVEVRLERLEEESIEWYDENEEDGNTSSFIEDSDEDGDISVVDPAVEAAERREAEVSVLQRLHDHNTAYTHNQDRHDFNVRQDAVERQWGSLYNKESHRKLQNAIVNQLESLSLV
jgi:hypothetical protein